MWACLKLTKNVHPVTSWYPDQEAEHFQHPETHSRPLCSCEDLWRSKDYADVDHLLITMNSASFWSFCTNTNWINLYVFVCLAFVIQHLFVNFSHVVFGRCYSCSLMIIFQFVHPNIDWQFYSFHIFTF